MNGVAQSGLKPEERARAKIDQLLRNVGWQVVARGDYSSALSAAAIEEGILRGGLEADYLLFLDGRAIGVLEAKREGTDLEAVAAAQAENYTHKVPDWVKVWFPGRPLPLVYLSDGNRLLFRGDDGSYVPLASSGTYTAEVLASENEMATLARGRRAFGSVPAFDAALKSLSRFLFGNGA